MLVALGTVSLSCCAHMSGLLQMRAVLLVAGCTASAESHRYRLLHGLLASQYSGHDGVVPYAR